MANAEKFGRPVIRFFVWTYLIFWALFMATGMVIMLKAPQTVQYVMPIICAWAPTFAVLILFKRLMPHLTLREFLKQQFPPLKASVVIAVLAAQSLAWLAIVSSYSIMNKVALSSILITSLPAIVVGFFDQLVRGSTGEELGWRGYALNELQKSYSPLSSALIIGVVWGFWHLPLWLVTSGYSGIELIQYMVLFTVGLIATSVVITAFYNLNKNLLIPILIHQLFNFGASIMSFDALQQLFYIDIVYLALAAILIVANPNKVLYGTGYSLPQLPLSPDRR